MMSTLSALQAEHEGSLPWSRFDCREDPFRTGFDDRFVYLSHAAQDLLSRLRRDLRSPKGLSLITGPPGTGKTTLLRSFVASLQPENPFVLFFAVPVSTLDDMVRMGREQAGALDREGIEGADPASDLQGLISRLDPARVRLVVIDEAQSLPDRLLDDLLTLTAAGGDGVSQLPIVLAGDRTLALRLAEAPFSERARSVGYRHELTPLDRSEVDAFIRHRLQAAGCTAAAPFTPDAIERLADYANGVPATINSLCRLAFFFAADQDQDRVTATSVDLAASAALLDQDPSKLSRLWSLPVNRFAPKGRESTQVTVAAGIGETVSSARLDDDRPRTPSPVSAIAPQPVPPGQGHGLATWAHRPPVSGNIGKPRAHRGALAWTAAAVSAILGFAAIAPRLYDAAWTWSHTAASRLVPSTGTESIAPKDPAASPETAMPRPGGTSSPETPAPSIPRERGKGDSERSATLDEAPVARAVEQPEPSLAAATGSEHPSLAAPASGDNPDPTESARRTVVMLKPGAPSPMDARESDDAARDDPEIGRLLALAEAHFRADRLVAPRFDNALATYRKVLRADPGNPAALAGIASLKSKLVEYAQAEAARGDLASARRQLDKIRLLEAEGLAGIGGPRSTGPLGDTPDTLHSEASLPPRGIGRIDNPATEGPIGNTRLESSEPLREER